MGSVACNNVLNLKWNVLTAYTDDATDTDKFVIVLMSPLRLKLRYKKPKFTQ